MVKSQMDEDAIEMTNETCPAFEVGILLFVANSTRRETTFRLAQRATFKFAGFAI
jgi:hypothetical protein